TGSCTSPSWHGWAPVSRPTAPSRLSAACPATRARRSWRPTCAPPPRSCSRGWPRVGRPSSRASTTWTAVTSASRSSSERSGPGSCGAHERRAHARAPQGPVAGPGAGAPARRWRGGDRRGLAQADLHRPEARPARAVPEARRHPGVRPLRRRGSRDRRQGHPSRAGAGRVWGGRGCGDHALDGPRHREPGVDEDPARAGDRSHRGDGARTAPPSDCLRPPTECGGPRGVGMKSDERNGADSPLVSAHPIRVIDARQLGLGAVVEALARSPAAVPPEIHRAVDRILADVRARGDAALLELTARFDGFTAATPTELVITPDEFETAERRLAPEVRAALAYAAERIERYH